MSSAVAQSGQASIPRRVNAAPTVAVSATSDATPGGGHRVRLNSAYIHALESAGLIPLIVPPLASDDAAWAIAERVDGIVLTGGEDVDPSLYGQPRIPECGAANMARDRTEMALAHAARDLKKPLLAICRGPQMLNVALGGTLFQDIPAQVADALEHNAKDARSSRIHPVRIEAGSRIAEAIGASDISVNSLHHQSVRDVAPGLVATAHSPDGVIEGIESSDSDWWVIAVQWHPEEMSDSPEPWDRGIFRAFAEKLTGR